MTQGSNGAPDSGEGGPRGSFPGGFRVYGIGRDAATRFRMKPPWRARAAAGPLERALVGAGTFLLAIPVALLMLALGVLLLATFLGCAAVFVAFALAMWLVRSLFGVGGSRRAAARGTVDDGRENVRVLRRNDPSG